MGPPQLSNAVQRQIIEHVDDISFRERFVRTGCFLLQNKIWPFLCIYVGHFFYETQLDQLP